MASNMHGIFGPFVDSDPNVPMKNKRIAAWLVICGDIFFTVAGFMVADASGVLGYLLGDRSFEPDWPFGLANLGMGIAYLVFVVGGIIFMIRPSRKAHFVYRTLLYVLILMLIVGAIAAFKYDRYASGMLVLAICMAYGSIWATRKCIVQEG